MNADILKAIPFFAGLSRVDLAKLLPELEERSFAKGDVIYSPGDPADSLYLIVSGEVAIYSFQDETRQRVATLKSGDFFGEMALLTGETRNAMVTAVVDLLVLKLQKDKFQQILKNHHSVALHVSRLLSERLARANRKLGKIRLKEYKHVESYIHFLNDEELQILSHLLLLPYIRTEREYPFLAGLRYKEFIAEMVSYKFLLEGGRGDLLWNKTWQGYILQLVPPAEAEGVVAHFVRQNDYGYAVDICKELHRYDLLEELLSGPGPSGPEPAPDPGKMADAAVVVLENDFVVKLPVLLDILEKCEAAGYHFEAIRLGELLAESFLQQLDTGQQIILYRNLSKANLATENSCRAMQYAGNLISLAGATGNNALSTEAQEYFYDQSCKLGDYRQAVDWADKAAGTWLTKRKASGAGMFAAVPARLVHSKAVLFFLTLAAAAALYFFLSVHGWQKSHAQIASLLLCATFFWTFNIMPFNIVALCLPLSVVLLRITDANVAFSGFSSSSWFLVLGVFSIGTAIAKTGLLFRASLWLMRRFPRNYTGQSFALAITGLLLTPVLPSSNGRAALASPLAQSISDALKFKDQSRGSAGLAMNCLLGFGHMSFMFLNGTATCFLVLSLIPAKFSGWITWGSWFTTALPLGLLFFFLSFLTNMALYRPETKTEISAEVLAVQIKTLGRFTVSEMVTLLIVLFTLAGFITQSLHNINSAWIAVTALTLLTSFSVIEEKDIKGKVDWGFLISFGALVGFANVITGTGLSKHLASVINSQLDLTAVNPYLFLLLLSMAVMIIRLALPLPPTQLIVMLSLMPVIELTGIHPFIVGLVVLVSSNPFFVPFQDAMYLNVLYGTEERAFKHKQTLPAAFAYALVTLVSIAATIPYWKASGLII